MQPHSAAIILALFHHHYFSPGDTYYKVSARSSNRKTKGPNELSYHLYLRSGGPREFIFEVGGDINYSAFRDCKATITIDDPKKEHFRMRHNHSHISTEEWSTSYNSIYDGRYISGDSSRSAGFDIYLHGNRSATFKEKGGLYEIWEVNLD